MIEALNTLSKYGIPVNSYVSAIQSLSDIELTEDQYQARMKELTGIDSNVENKHIRIHYHYLVQEIVRTSMNTDTLDMINVIGKSTEKAEVYCDTHSWTFVSKDSASQITKVDAEGNVKPKKGEKKRLAKATWEKNKNNTLSRKEWIALLVDEVKLTPAGASTYYSNLKNGKL